MTRGLRAEAGPAPEDGAATKAVMCFVSLECYHRHFPPPLIAGDKQRIIQHKHRKTRFLLPKVGVRHVRHEDDGATRRFARAEEPLFAHE